MKNKILLVGSLLVLVLVVGFFVWSYQKGNVKMFAIAPKISPSPSGGTARIAGYTKYQNGVVANGAWVLLYKVGAHNTVGSVASTMSDGSGHYELNNVSPVSSPNYYFLKAVGTDFWGSQATSSSFILKQNENKRIDLTLVQMSMLIKGDITDAVTGKPITNFNYKIIYDNDLESTIAAVLPDGHYEIWADDSYKSYKIFADGYIDNSPMIPITCIPGTTVTKDFQLTPISPPVE